MAWQQVSVPGMMLRSQTTTTSLSLHWQTRTEESWNRKRKRSPITCTGRCLLSLLENLNLFDLLYLFRTQFKKFLGKSVKKAKHLAEEYGEKAVNKVKSVRDEGTKCGIFHDFCGLFVFCRIIRTETFHFVLRVSVIELFTNILSGGFCAWCSQCSTQTQMIRRPVTTRACLTPDPPSSRQRTVSKDPLTSIRLRLCRTWVESTWWGHLWSCSWFQKGTKVLFHSLFAFLQGAVWTMKFSHCGRLLATAGQDNMVRIWVLKTAFDYFNNMRIKYNTEGK